MGPPLANEELTTFNPALTVTQKSTSLKVGCDIEISTQITGLATAYGTLNIRAKYSN